MLIERLCTKGGSIFIVFIIAVGWLAAFWVPEKVSGTEPAAQVVDIEVFTREGCAHCLAAQRFL